MSAPGPWVVVDDLAAPALDPADAHHLGRVRRLRPGEAVGATDGRGGYWPCTWVDGALEPSGPPVLVPPPKPRVSVAFCPVKGDRPEWVVQKLTELGVDSIVLIDAERSVVRWAGDRAPRHVDKLRRVAREAVMQSHQVRLPAIEGPLPLSSVAGRPGAALCAPGGPPPSLDRPLLLVGPEGGWSDAELVAAPATVGLGPSVLRAETAAVAAGVLLCGLRAGVVGPAGR